MYILSIFKKIDLTIFKIKVPIYQIVCMYVKEKKNFLNNPKLLDYWMNDTINEKVKINNNNVNKSYNKLDNFSKLKVSKQK